MTIMFDLVPVLICSCLFFIDPKVVVGILWVSMSISTGYSYIDQCMKNNVEINPWLGLWIAFTAPALFLEIAIERSLMMLGLRDPNDDDKVLFYFDIEEEDDDEEEDKDDDDKSKT